MPAPQTEALQKTFEFPGRNGLTNMKPLLNTGKDFLSSCRGCNFSSEGSVQSALSIQKWATDLGFAATVFDFLTNGTALDIYAGSVGPSNPSGDGRIFRLNIATVSSSSASWGAIAGTYVQPAGANSYRNAAILNGSIYFSSSTNTDLVKVTGGTGSTVATHPVMQYIRSYNNRLYGWDRNSAILNWSDLLDGTVWAAGSAGSLDLKTVFPNYDVIQDITVFGGKLIIFGKKNTCIFSLTGDASTANVTYTIALDEVFQNIGIQSEKNFANIGSDLILFNGKAFYSFSRLVQTNGSLPSSQIITQYSFSKWLYSPSGNSLTAGYDKDQNIIYWYSGLREDYALPTPQPPSPILFSMNMNNAVFTDNQLIPLTIDISEVYNGTNLGAITFPTNYDHFTYKFRLDGTSAGFPMLNLLAPVAGTLMPQFFRFEAKADSSWPITRSFATNWMDLDTPDNIKNLTKITLQVSPNVNLNYLGNSTPLLVGKTVKVNVYVDKDFNNVFSTETYTFLAADDGKANVNIAMPIGGTGRQFRFEFITNYPGLLFNTIILDYRGSRVTFGNN